MTKPTRALPHDLVASRAEGNDILSSSNHIRVMIVDDHTMVRKGLATILRLKADLELVGEASNGQEALQLCDQVQPDVILMDLVMPEMDGAAATRAIRARCPQVRVIALTSFTEKELVERALEAGAIGYLLKNVSADELADAIRAAYAGRPTIAPEVTQVLLQTGKLEQLTRALVDAPPDASTLPVLLSEHVPGMFPDSQIEIRLLPEQVLLHHPVDWPPVPRLLWEWLNGSPGHHCFLPGTTLPWRDSQTTDEGLLMVSIMAGENFEPIGGIYVARRRDPGTVTDLLPIVKSLAAQIASALHSAQVYAQTLVHEKMARELAMAGQIQASFLPGSLPTLSGWQVAATLEPARETSGDFFDFIALPNEKLGIVIADVSDKGMGAALYMALSRTLIRTYAAEYPTRPDLVLSATSHRILSDTRAGLFVTVFYGILDPATGLLIYCNAGHCPPCLLRRQDTNIIQGLGKTGMALGAVEDTAWNYGTVQLDPGDLLVLYSDGITEAQDPQGRLLGQERLRELLRQAVTSQGHRSAQDIQKALLAQVHRFRGGAPQHDDTTVVILVRSSEQGR